MANTDLNRRQVLKGIIAAGGAITVASFLPGKWLKPVVKVGVLPVHAQLSLMGISGNISSGGSPVVGSIVYADPSIVKKQDTKGRGLAKLAKPAPIYHDETDTNGDYFISCPAGHYYVFVDISGSPHWYGEPDEVTVIEGSITSGIDITVGIPK